MSCICTLWLPVELIKRSHVQRMKGKSEAMVFFLISSLLGQCGVTASLQAIGPATQHCPYSYNRHTTSYVFSLVVQSSLRCKGSMLLIFWDRSPSFPLSVCLSPVCTLSSSIIKRFLIIQLVHFICFQSG
jgi:hypothetical protein